MPLVCIHDRLLNVNDNKTERQNHFILIYYLFVNYYSHFVHKIIKDQIEPERI